MKESKDRNAKCWMSLDESSVHVLKLWLQSQGGERDREPGARNFHK